VPRQHLHGPDIGSRCGRTAIGENLSWPMRSGLDGQHMGPNGFPCKASSATPRPVNVGPLYPGLLAFECASSLDAQPDRLVRADRARIREA
jgi:hypothetical protein